MTEQIPRTADQEFGDLHRDGFSEALIQTDDFDGQVIIVKNEESLGIQTDPYIEKPIIHRKPPETARRKGLEASCPVMDANTVNQDCCVCP
jgi:hypothetical protein